MESSLNAIVFNWKILILVTVRFYAMMIVCPAFMDKLPKMIKMLLGLSFAVIVFQYYDYTHQVVFSNVEYSLLIVKELIIGYILGVLFSFPFWLVEGIGNLIDTQRGEQFGAIISSITTSPSSSIAKLLSQGFMVYFLVSNGLLFILQLVFTSFTIFPVIKFVNHIHYSKELFINFFTNYFYWLVLLSLPIILIMFLLELVLGLLNSFVQQINVTSLAMPLKSMLAIFLLIFYIGVLYRVSLQQFGQNAFFDIFNAR